MTVTLFVSLGPDGQIFINEGSNDEGNLLVELSAHTLTSLDFFREDKPNVNRDMFHDTYRVDGERCAQICEWLLNDKSYRFVSPDDFVDFEVKMVRLCSPGGPAPFWPSNGFAIRAELVKD